MNHLTDEELVYQYKTQKNENILEVLIKRYILSVYGFTRNYTGSNDNASDITQEVFVKVWKNINKFDESKSFKTWIFTIAKNTAIDWLKHKTELRLDDSFDLVDDTPSVLEQMIIREKSEKLSFAIAKLPSSYSSVIELYMKDGLNFREISEFTKESINTVKSKYRRGLILLGKLMG